MNVGLRQFSNPTTILLLKAFLSIIVLWVLFTMISVRGLFEAWSQASLSGIVAALVLVPAHLLIRAHRWRVLLNDAGETQEAGRALRTVIIGYAFAVTTPAEVGEVAARIKLHDGAATPKILGLVVVEKLLHSFLILVAALPALAFHVWGDAKISWSIAIVMISIFLMTAAVTPRLTAVTFDEHHPRWRSLAKTLRAMGSVSRSSLTSLATATAAILLIYVAQEYLLMNAVVQLGFADTWNGFWAGMGVRTLAPIFVMDLGIREASHVIFFGRYGVDASSAVAVSLLMFTLNILLPSLVGLLMMFRKAPTAP